MPGSDSDIPDCLSFSEWERCLEKVLDSRQDNSEPACVVRKELLDGLLAAIRFETKTKSRPQVGTRAMFVVSDQQLKYWDYVLNQWCRDAKKWPPSLRDVLNRDEVKPFWKALFGDIAKANYNVEGFKLGGDPGVEITGTLLATNMGHHQGSILQRPGRFDERASERVSIPHFSSSGPVHGEDQERDPFGSTSAGVQYRYRSQSSSASSGSSGSSEDSRDFPYDVESIPYHVPVQAPSPNKRVERRNRNASNPFSPGPRSQLQ